MANYTDVFGSYTLPPSEYGYRSLAITTDTTLVWPYNADSGADAVAKIIDISCNSGNVITLPDARDVSVGEDFLVRNIGSNTLQVKNAGGVLVATVAVGAASYFYLTDNTTLSGVFGVIGFGIGTSTVDAASLVGYGVKAIGASLNQAHPTVPTNSGLLLDATYRSKLVIFTGGTGTFTLDSVSTLGDDYFVMFRNDGTGTATIDPSGSQLVDGQVTMQVQPGESLMLICTGSAWYSVGYGRSTLYQFTQLTKDVSAGGTITLSAAEAANKLITFIGNPSGAVTVIAPSIVAVYYTYSNISTAQTVTFKTAAGSGVGISQGARIITLCDGTNMLSAQSAVANAAVSLSDGSAVVPSLFFASQTNTGIFKTGADGLGITVNGASVATFTTAGGAQITAPQTYSQYSAVAAAPSYAEGRVFYDNVEHTLAYYNDATGVTVNIGQEMLVRVRNNTGSTLTDGQVVYINGATGSRPTVALAKADAEATSMGTLGIVTNAILNNADGYITVGGLVHDLNTLAYAEGTLLYLSAATAGAFTGTAPVAPNHAVRLGYVTRQHSTQGVVFVRVDNGYDLDELHDVLITSPTNGQFLTYDSAAGVWKNTGLTIPQVISVNSSSDALRITQSGSGNALVVEDATSPDATPFVVTGAGSVIRGNTSTINLINPDTGAANGPQLETVGLNVAEAGIGSVLHLNNAGQAGYLAFAKSRGTTVGDMATLLSGDIIGYVSFQGSDGTSFSRAANISAAVDGTPGPGDMPGRLVFSTTPDGTAAPVERMRIDSAGQVGIGAASAAGNNLRVGKNITGSNSGNGVWVHGVVQPDVTTTVNYIGAATYQAAGGTLTTLRQFYADQGTISGTVTGQYGFVAQNSLTSATNNYGFYSNIPAPTAGTQTAATITSISSSGTTATLTCVNTYTNGQTVTINATANATDLVSGVPVTILTVGTTDYTLIGAASNTVGVSFTATGPGTGTGTVTLQCQGSGKTVAGASGTSFTIVGPSATHAAVTLLTGNVTVSKRWNFYAGGTADNYFAGYTNFATPSAIKLPVGNSAQRPSTPAQGDIRYNTDTTSFEGYSGSTWGSIGAGAKGGGSNQVFFENDTNVTSDYTITSGKNAMTAGPITVDNGVTVTVPNGSVWSVI